MTEHLSPPPELWAISAEALLYLIFFVEYLLPEITGSDRHVANRDKGPEPVLMTSVLILLLLNRIGTRWCDTEVWFILAQWVVIPVSTILLLLWLADLVKRWRAGAQKE